MAHASDDVSRSTTKESDSHSSDLSNYFERSAAAVHAYTAQLDTEYARPAVKRGQSFYGERPILATFLGVFALLSAIPVLLFIGLTTASFVCLSLAAVSTVAVLSITITLGLLFCLLWILAGTFVTSLFVSGGLLSMYALARVVILVKEEGPIPAATKLINETKERLSALTEGYWGGRDVAVGVSHHTSGDVKDPAEL